MRKKYNKLVRDLIPDIIRQDGREFEIETMTEDEFCNALRIKLVEEAKEVAEADPQKLITELADIFEVVDTILAAFQIEREAVVDEQLARRADRGGFERMTRLLWVE